MQIIISHVKDKKRLWLKQEHDTLYLSITDIRSPIDIMNIIWTPTDSITLQHEQPFLYKKLKQELELQQKQVQMQD